MYLWRWFMQLRRRCGGDSGLAPIGWEAAGAWARLLRIDPRPWEIEIIMAIDDAFLAARAGGQDPES